MKKKGVIASKGVSATRIQKPFLADKLFSKVIAPVAQKKST